MSAPFTPEQGAPSVDPDAPTGCADDAIWANFDADALRDALPVVTLAQETPMHRTADERETALACLKIAMEKAEFATSSQEIVDTAARFYEFAFYRASARPEAGSDTNRVN